MFFAGRFTLSQSSPPVKNVTYLPAFFLEFIHVFREILSTSMFFRCSIYIETAQNSREECNEFVLKTINMHFKRLFVLWHSLIKSLYIIQVFIFVPLIHSAPFLRFWHILLYTIFFMYILPSKIFFLSLMTLLLGISLLFLISAVKGLIWDLSYVLSNVFIQWNFPWNISTNLLIFTNKASSHVAIVLNKSESLECAKGVVLKLGAILFYSGTILNL